jgi:hypothetical protein
METDDDRMTEGRMTEQGYIIIMSKPFNGGDIKKKHLHMPITTKT